jgi:nitroimidazol reductase NimA-like FMN-containing flavoprotein (pyridoxamine 5'-phosphate oxidase superfamily)
VVRLDGNGGLTVEADWSGELTRIDPTTCTALLATQHVGRLAFGGDEPEIFPIRYHTTDGMINIRVRPDSRAARPDPGPFVFEVDQFDERTGSGWSVVVRGTLRAVPAGERSDPADDWMLGERTHWMVLTIDSVTGERLDRDRRKRPRGMRRR